MVKLECISCNICNSDNTILLFKLMESNIVKCKKCGLIYRNPRLSEEEFNKFFHILPLEINEELIFSKKQLFSEFLGKIEKIKKKGKILDVGCGSGYFLKIAKDSGWDVYGIEVNPHSIEFAKDKFGITVEKKNLKELNNEEFDVVTLLKILDLFRNPKEELKEVKRILKKDGLLVIHVNNGVWHCNLERFRRFFASFGFYPAVLHLYSFTPKTVKKLLQDVGFTDIEISNSGFTKGDPYKTDSYFSGVVVVIVKFLVKLISQILYLLSFKKVCIAPSILVFARKR